jgi:hypothetical protein
MNALALDPHGLTMRDRGMVIYGPGKKRLGCVIGLANGLWAAWNMHKKLGEYPTAIAAEHAVRSPPKPPGKPRTWEVRS